MALAELITRHLTVMRASSPACSVHAMDASSLAEADVRFFAAFESGDAVAMGALKEISPEHGELKSMHVVAEKRGQGLAEKMLKVLLETARDCGMIRVSLETGSQDAFIPARAFYTRNGFEYCDPFEGYVEDPNSVFMSLSL